MEKLEGVQRRFVFTIHGRFFRHVLYDYHALLRVLDMLTIHNQLMYRNVLFLHSVVRGDVYAPHLLSEINFRVPTKTRSSDTFIVKNSFSVMSRLCREFNVLNCKLDLFGMSKATFKKELRKLLK